MDWSDCLKDKVKKIKPDPERAESLRKLAVKRMESIERRRDTEDPEFLVEDYYECIKELVTSILCRQGYKSYSHECLIAFLKENQKEFTVHELELIDQMRRTRNDLLYRGEPIAKEFLERREKNICGIIEKLIKITSP